MFYKEYVVIYVSILFMVFSMSFKIQKVKNTNVINTSTNDVLVMFFDKYQDALGNMDGETIKNYISEDYRYILKGSMQGKSCIYDKIANNKRFLKKLNLNYHIYSIQYIGKKYFIIIYILKSKMLVKLPSFNKWAKRTDINYIILEYRNGYISVIEGM